MRNIILHDDDDDDDDDNYINMIQCPSIRLCSGSITETNNDTDYVQIGFCFRKE